MIPSIHPIKILAVDDHPLFREGISALIGDESDMKLIATASSGAEAIEQFRLNSPDITLMDLRLPDMGGIDALVAIRREFERAKIIVLTTYAGDVLAKRALMAGARAYILKDLPKGQILDTIRTVHNGGLWIQPEVAADLADRASDPSLTARELEVLTLIAAGNSNKETAAALGIDDQTVKGHVKNLLTKLGARDRTQAAIIAYERGYLGP